MVSIGGPGGGLSGGGLSGGGLCAGGAQVIGSPIAWQTATAKWLPTARASPVVIDAAATLEPGPAVVVVPVPFDVTSAVLWPVSPSAIPMLSTAVTWRTVRDASASGSVPGSPT